MKALDNSDLILESSPFNLDSSVKANNNGIMIIATTVIVRINFPKFNRRLFIVEFSNGFGAYQLI